MLFPSQKHVHQSYQRREARDIPLRRSGWGRGPPFLPVRTEKVPLSLSLSHDLDLGSKKVINKLIHTIKEVTKVNMNINQQDSYTQKWKHMQWSPTHNPRKKEKGNVLGLRCISVLQTGLARAKPRHGLQSLSYSSYKTLLQPQEQARIPEEMTSVFTHC